MNALPLDDELLARLLAPYGMTVDHRLCDQIRSYISILIEWNKKVSLTTITDPKDIVCRHFGESFFAALAAGIEKGRVADIGTGPGFPGIPIRMVRPYVNLTLVEPNVKKAAFLGEVVRKLDVDGVSIIRCRMEELPTNTEQFQFITARALGHYHIFLALADGMLDDEGKVALLIGEKEVSSILETPGWKWHENVKIPGSNATFVLIGSPIRQ